MLEANRDSHVVGGREQPPETPPPQAEEETVVDAPLVYLDEQGRSFDDFAQAAEAALRAGDKAKEKEVRGEQVRFLYDQFAKRYPEVLQIPREIQGFYFFEVNSQNALEGQVAGRATLDAVSAYEADPSSDRWKEIIDRNRDRILGEYRINLRPQKEYVPETIERLLKLFRDPRLRDAVASFKVKVGPSAPDPDRPEEAFTEIVMYAKNDPTRDADGKTGSRRSFEALFPAVREAMADFNAYAQTSPIKRKSAKVNELLTVSQSGGDFRGLLQRVDRDRGTHYLDEYFEGSENYAFARGEEPPTLETAARARDGENLRQVRDDLQEMN